MTSLSELYKSRSKEYKRAAYWLKRYAKHEPVRTNHKTYWHDDDIAAYHEAQQAPEDYTSLSDVYERGSTEYWRVLSYLQNHAKCEPVRIGCKTFWHNGDIEFVPSTDEKPVQWQSEIYELFATPRTINEVLDMLAERGKFPTVSAAHRAVAKYQKLGVLKRVDTRHGVTRPVNVYVIA